MRECLAFTYFQPVQLIAEARFMFDLYYFRRQSSFSANTLEPLVCHTPTSRCLLGRRQLEMLYQVRRKRQEWRLFALL